MKTLPIYKKLHNEFKKYFLYSICMIVGTFGIMFAQISHSVNFLQSNISHSTIIARDSNSYNVISIEGMFPSREIGNPKLPVKYINLIIPPNQEVANIVITGKQNAEIPGSFMIYPVQYLIPTKDGELPPFVKPNDATYSSDELYPKENVKVIHDGFFDGSNRIVTLAVSPVQYKPKSGKLIFHSSIDFQLVLTSSTKKPIYVQQRSEKVQETYNSILKNLVDNPGSIGVYQTPTTLKTESGLQKTTTLPFYEYVIITSNALKPYFSNFVTWKKRKGLKK